MADKVVLTSIDIDVEKAIQDTQELKERVASLRAETDNLKKTQGETSKEYILASANLKANQAELRTQENLIAKVVTANQANIGSLDAMKAELSVVSKQWSALSESERLNTDQGKKLTARKLELTKALKKEEIATGDARRNVGNYAEALERIPGPMGRITSQSKSFITNLAKLGPVGASVAVAVGAISAPLIAFFTKSEKGFEMMERKMAGVKAAWGVLVGELIRGGEKMAEGFDKNEKKTSFWSKAMVALGTSIFQITGNPKHLQYFTEIGIQMGIASDAAEEYTGKMQELEDLERGMIVPRATTNQQIAQAKLLYEDETKSIDSRIGALERSLNLEIETNQKEIEHQKLVVNNIHQINELKKQSGQLRDDDLKKEEEAKAKVIDLETESIIKRRKLQSTLNKANDELRRQTEKQQEEEVDNSRELAEERVKILEYEVKKYLQANLEKFEDFQKIYELEKNVLDEQLQSKLISINDYNLAVIDLEKQKDEEIKNQKIEASQVDYENNLALTEENIFEQLRIEEEGLVLKEQQEIAAAERIGANTTLIEQKYSKAKKEIAKIERDAKLALASDFAKNIATIAGEQTAIGKAAAVAGTTIDTFRGAQAAFTGMTSTIPGPVGIGLGIAAAAAAVVSGLANVKKILAVKSGLPGEGNVSGGSAAGGSSTPAPRVVTSVNPEIGQGIVSRQIGDAGKQIETPQSEKVVVIDEVTAKQRLDNSQQKTSVL